MAASIFVIGADSGWRGSLQSCQAVQHSADAGWVPFAAQCSWYLSLIQLARDATK
jgi:hypothetical protein